MLTFAVLALALANGANDTSKGVATLIGSGSLSARNALALATLATFAGSVAAVALGAVLAARFGGMGIVPAEVARSPALRTAAASGAALVVGLAAAAGLPISTTHALVGGLVGAGVAQVGVYAVGWRHAATSMLLPLLVAPVLSILVALAVGWLVRRFPLPVRHHHTAHGISAGLVSFARGLNDTPKIAGLWMLAGADTTLPTLAVAATMALGALGAVRVGDTMARGITTLDPRSGATANFATSLVVLLASPLSLPVSTTHVSVAALLGVSAGAIGPAVSRVALAWFLTLPLAALTALAIGAMG